MPLNREAQENYDKTKKTDDDWHSKFKKDQKNKALRFALSNPFPRLILMLVQMQVSKLMHMKLLNISGQDFDLEEAKKRINGEFAGFRIWEALRGGITNPAFEKAEQIFHQPAEWNALPQCFHTWQYEALAWSMMSAFLCSIDALMVSVCTSYPLKIFWLLFLDGQELIDFAIQVLKDPNCLKDTWTIKFLEKFNNVDLLLSETCTAILLTLLVLLRLDIARIECGPCRKTNFKK